MRFQSIATIETLRGGTADARNLFQLLLLGVAPGEEVTVRCRGLDAIEAIEAIADVLCGEKVGDG